MEFIERCLASQLPTLPGDAALNAGTSPFPPRDDGSLFAEMRRAATPNAAQVSMVATKPVFSRRPWVLLDDETSTQAGKSSTKRSVIA